MGQKHANRQDCASASVKCESLALEVEAELLQKIADALAAGTIEPAAALGEIQAAADRIAAMRQQALQG